jgi:RNA polymerase sigma-70 factor (ECF subfamily)
MNAIGAASLDERDLMRSLHEGSVTALAALYERTAPYLYPLALRIVGSRERACAVIEDLFEELWRDRATWRGAVQIPAVPWIARCRELALAQVGPEPRRPATDPVAAFAAPPAAAPAASDGSVADPRVNAREALASLPEPDRRALEEVYFCGTSAREVAVLIGAPTSDAAMTVRTALVRFREHLSERETIEAEAGRAS